MKSELAGFAPPPWPERVALIGDYTRLEPIDDACHGDALFEASSVPDVEVRFRWLFDQPPADRAALRAWIAQTALVADPVCFAVVDAASGLAEGRQSLMRITPQHGVIEIGSIYWGPRISRSRVATEAQFLFAQYVFDTLGYRRYEWKCDALNEPSRRAALRFGFRFEGVFRQHMVIKGMNRDTAWFAMIDREWPALKAGYERWLDAANFDGAGVQRRSLGECLRH
ncbi:MAG: GNAT family N-acetyltransferase [Proteobacteria bacterium]|nr:GNAT family N-acetyltransferase [Burkholderiales bacterium]